MAENHTPLDLLIVGAGPAGIAAAVTAAEAGQRVGLIDDAPFAGGQIWRNRGEPARGRAARYWLSRLDAVADSIRWMRQSRVVASPSPSALLVQTLRGPQLVQWKSLVLATGARELFLPFPGWTLPGVFGAGGIQALVKQGLPVAGRRIVVAGTGPLLLAVADFLRSKGARVPLIIEQAASARIHHFVASLARSPAKLVAGISLRARLLGTRYSTDSYAVEVLPAPGGLRIAYQTGQRTGSIECDYFACGFNLIPNVELPTLLGCDVAGDRFVSVDNHLRTSVKNIYAVGELTGIGGVDKAIIEGRIAAHAAAGNKIAADLLARDHMALLRFTRRLSDAFALRPELLRTVAA